MSETGRRHPIQGTEVDRHGTIRFRANAIVRRMLDEGPWTLNDIARWGCNDGDYEQLMQLIGYSLGGFCELACASQEAYDMADAILRDAVEATDA